MQGTKLTGIIYPVHPYMIPHLPHASVNCATFLTYIMSAKKRKFTQTVGIRIKSNAWLSASSNLRVPLTGRMGSRGASTHWRIQGTFRAVPKDPMGPV